MDLVTTLVFDAVVLWYVARHVRHISFPSSGFVFSLTRIAAGTDDTEEVILTALFK
jgi:hypothetical protein